MGFKYQKMLEKVYEVICEGKEEVESGFRDPVEIRERHSDLMPGDLKLGEVALVNGDEDFWMISRDKDLIKFKDPYRSNWRELIGKCGVAVGYKRVTDELVFGVAWSYDSSLGLDSRGKYTRVWQNRIIYGIRRPDGKVYEIPCELLTKFIPEEVRGKYDVEVKLAHITDILPELKGIF